MLLLNKYVLLPDDSVESVEDANSVVYTDIRKWCPLVENWETLESTDSFNTDCKTQYHKKKKKNPTQ